MIVAWNTFVSVSISGVVLLLIVVIGYPFQLVLTRIKPNLPATLGSCALLGMTLLSMISWYAFEFGLELKLCYAATVFITLTFGSIWKIGGIFYGSRPWISTFSRKNPWIPDLAAFFVSSTGYSILLSTKIAPSTLPWVIDINHDIFAYLKIGRYLSDYPHDLPMVGSLNLQSFVANDVFGAFNLIGFTASLLDLGIEQLAMPILGLAVGLLGVAIARSCRKVFCLSLPVALCTMLAILISPLFFYIELNYFLSQIFFVAIFVTAIGLVSEAAMLRRLDFIWSTIIVCVASIAVLMFYPTWLVHFVVLLALFSSALRISLFTSRLKVESEETDRATGGRCGKGVARVIASAVSSGIGYLVITGAVLASLSPSRSMLAVSKLIESSQANIAGWPLSFVNPGLIIGLPVDWRMQDVAPNIVQQSLVAFMLIASASALSFAFDRGPGFFVRRLQLAALTASIAAYLAVWYHFGPSYQQWKFATTLPLATGYVCAASFLFLSNQISRDKTRRVVLSFVVMSLLVSIGLSTQQFYDRWALNVQILPTSLKSAQEIDRIAGTDRGYIDVDSFSLAMAAAIFVDHKPLTFSMLTYYGPASPTPSLEGGAFAEFRPQCGTSESSIQSYQTIKITTDDLPAVRLGETIPIAALGKACFDLSGFTVAQSWGRYTNRPHASIRFRCECNLSRGEKEIVLDASAYLTAERTRQRVMISVNGSPAQETDFDTSTFRAVVLMISPQTTDNEIIDVEMDLPDAVATTADVSPDGERLGMAVKSLIVRPITAP